MPKMVRLVISALTAGGVAASMAAAPASAASARYHPHQASAAAQPNCPTVTNAVCSQNFVATVSAGVGTNMCLDDELSGDANGDTVDIYQCNGTRAQTWDFIYLGSPGVYEIKSGVDASMCLDDYGGSSANYNRIDIWECNGHTSQRWLLAGTAVHVFGSPTGPCLDVYHSGTANFTNVDIYQCNGTAAQSWTIN
jgi:hypothetical protein